MPKLIDTKEYVAALRDIVLEGHEASMVIWGWSMTPFLGHGRDRIFFSAPSRPLKRGDMVFYQRDNDQFVMHRICKVGKDGYYIVGDAQTMIEGPVREDQIFALITRVERKGKMIDEEDSLWKFFAGPWLTLLPFRPLIVRVYSMIKGR